jgi:hypothetical protein
MTVNIGRDSPNPIFPIRARPLFSALEKEKKKQLLINAIEKHLRLEQDQNLG